MSTSPKKQYGAFLDGYRTEAGILNMHGTKKTKQLSEEAMQLRRKKEVARIRRYRRLSDKILKEKENKVYNDEMLKLTTEMLEWNPEFYTVWNYRRDILTESKFPGLDNKQRHQVLAGELQFVLLKMKSFPKCYWLWNHRKWCLEQDKLADWRIEMALIGKFFQADPRNFHAWQYRRYVVGSLKKESPAKSAELDYSEFKFTTKMINEDISNYSAWHNRSALVVRLFEKSPEVDEKDAKLKAYLETFHRKSKNDFLQLELDLFQNAIYTDPDDSSVWIYVKWLFGDYFVSALSEEQGTKSIRMAYDMTVELAELEKEENDGKDNQWCLKTQLYLLGRLNTLYTTSESDAAHFEAIRQALIAQDPMRQQRYLRYRSLRPL